MFHIVAMGLFPVAGLIGCLAPFRREIAASWKELLLLSCFSFVFLAGPLLSDEVIPQKDANLLQIPFLQTCQLSLDGRQQPPLWNPSLWLGMPALAHPLFSVVNPTAALALALPVQTAFACGLFITLF